MGGWFRRPAWGPFGSSTSARHSASSPTHNFRSAACARGEGAGPNDSSHAPPPQPRQRPWCEPPPHSWLDSWATEARRLALSSTRRLSASTGMRLRAVVRACALVITWREILCGGVPGEALVRPVERRSAQRCRPTVRPCQGRPRKALSAAGESMSLPGLRAGEQESGSLSAGLVQGHGARSGCEGTEGLLPGLPGPVVRHATLGGAVAGCVERSPPLLVDGSIQRRLQHRRHVRTRGANGAQPLLRP